MTDNELLLAISDMMDKKLKPIKDDIHMLKLQNENDILPRLQNIEADYFSMPPASNTQPVICCFLLFIVPVMDILYYPLSHVF